MKKNSGISLVTLVISIIIIIILAAITIFYGLSKNADKAIETKSVYEVFSIVDAVTNRALMNRLNPSYYQYVGSQSFGDSQEGKMTIDGKEYTSDDGWYMVDSKDDFDELGLTNIDGQYLFNYEKGLALSVNTITYEGTEYHSLNELKKEMGGGSAVLASVEFDEAKKVNKPVLSTGMVPVKVVGGEWYVANVDDEGWYDYSSDQKAWANVMLKDGLEVEGYSNDAVREMSISELAGKKVTAEGSAYVWIPRYSTTSLGETGSEIIFSNLTNDVLSNGGKTYTVPEAFTYTDSLETISLPGIWVSKYEASFDR